MPPPSVTVHEDVGGSVGIWAGCKPEARDNVCALLREAAPVLIVEVFEDDQHLDRFDLVVVPYMLGTTSDKHLLPEGMATYVRHGGTLLGGAGCNAPPLNLLGIKVANGNTPPDIQNTKQQEVAAALGLEELPDSIESCKWIWSFSERELPVYVQMVYKQDYNGDTRSMLFRLPEGDGQVWFFGAEFDGHYDGYPKEWKDLFVTLLLCAMKRRRIICLQSAPTEEQSGDEFLVSCSGLGGEVARIATAKDTLFGDFRRALAAELGCTQASFRLVLARGEVLSYTCDETPVFSLLTCGGEVATQPPHDDDGAPSMGT